MKKIIFGFTGSIASGKDTAGDYLEKKHNGKNFSYSDMLGDVTKRFYLEFNRDNLIKVSEMIREKFGENIMAKTMAKDIEKDDHHITSISNIRRLADIEYLGKLPGFVLVSIEADLEVRYKRLTNRGEKTDDNNKTYEQFLEDHQRSTELSILEVVKQAKEKIDNNGSLEELHKQLDELVKKYEGEN